MRVAGFRNSEASMPIKYLRVVPVKAFSLGNFRSLPAEIGSTAPLIPVTSPKHMEYPQHMSLTAPETVISPCEPANGSPLAFPTVSTQTDTGAPSPPPEDETQDSIHGVPVPRSSAQEIEQALEIMRRVKIADLAQGKSEIVYPPGTKYIPPKPLVYPVSRSTDDD